MRGGRNRRGHFGVPSLEKFLNYWLEEMVHPPVTPSMQECKLSPGCIWFPTWDEAAATSSQVRDVRRWLNRLGRGCPVLRSG